MNNDVNALYINDFGAFRENLSARKINLIFASFVCILIDFEQIITQLCYDLSKQVKHECAPDRSQHQQNKKYKNQRKKKSKKQKEK